MSPVTPDPNGLTVNGKVETEYGVKRGLIRGRYEWHEVNDSGSRQGKDLLNSRKNGACDKDDESDRYREPDGGCSPFWRSETLE